MSLLGLKVIQLVKIELLTPVARNVVKKNVCMNKWDSLIKSDKGKATEKGDKCSYPHTSMMADIQHVSG